MRNNDNFKHIRAALKLSDADVCEIMHGSVSKTQINGWSRNEHAFRHGGERRFKPMSDDDFDAFCAGLREWIKT